MQHLGRRKIAAKHGIAVARDDPILVLQTINHRQLADSAKAQQAQLDTYKEELEALSARWGRAGKWRDGVPCKVVDDMLWVNLSATGRWVDTWGQNTAARE